MVDGPDAGVLDRDAGDVRVVAPWVEVQQEEVVVVGVVVVRHVGRKPVA